MNFKKTIPYWVAIPIFFLVTIAYFNVEILDGKKLPQSDLVQFEGMSHLSQEFAKESGEVALWNVAMFGGFPEYLFSSIQNDPLQYIFLTLNGFLHTAHEVPATVFCLMLCFWLMALCFRINPWVAIIGAVVFAFNAFYISSIEAGHMTKMWATAFACLVLGGMKLLFDRKILLGAGVLSLGLALQIRANHLQITYYLIFVCAIYAFSELYFAYKKGTVQKFMTQIAPVMLGAVLLGAATQTYKIWTTQEYSEYSIRGKRELTPLDGNKQDLGKDGLDKDYAFSWSEGKLESLTLLVPNFYGSSSQESISPDGPMAQALEQVAGKQQASRLVNDPNFKLPLYFGDQPFTAGPIYLGAVMCFLFALGVVLMENKTRWWMIASIILMAMISWGNNLQWFNYTLFDYFPGFNKFRTVAMALGVACLVMCLLGTLGLDKLIKEREQVDLKKLLCALGASGGVALLIFLTAGMMNTHGAQDASIFQRMLGTNDARVIGAFTDGIAAERVSFIRTDAIRSVVLIALAFVAIFLYIKEKISANIVLVVVGLLAVGDVWGVSKRYLNDSDFVKTRQKKSHVKTAADKEILKDKDPNYRVLNIAGNPFNEANTSYFHKSIGGYFAAKMRRYQDLIERELQPEQMKLFNGLKQGQIPADLPAINMLNAKYLKAGNNAKDVILNPHAMGHAWFVESVKTVQFADEEIAALGQLDVKKEAVLDESKFELSKTSYNVDGVATATLNSFNNRHISYSTSNANDGLLVFSEIYYPKGWEVKIDGKEVDMKRVNYVLRALEVPAGKHEITFDFNPSSFVAGSKVSYAASYLSLLIFLIAAGLSVKQRVEKK
ncbi:YfhO family protein [Sediminitomix flava]|uniref:Membrane protein YfhO n=1 Tax=Sediminitomix flava TaxID=379075 RepID=A0A315Z7C8_SEDFL|nr:YfhO family protein [Sediminitomix flava]PWJ40821.1 membrane protein YfhO [Sediminitomix flava]